MNLSLLWRIIASLASHLCGLFLLSNSELLPALSSSPSRSSLSPPSLSFPLCQPHPASHCTSDQVDLQDKIIDNIFSTLLSVSRTTIYSASCRLLDAAATERLCSRVFQLLARWWETSLRPTRTSLPPTRSASTATCVSSHETQGLPILGSRFWKIGQARQNFWHLRDMYQSLNYLTSSPPILLPPKVFDCQLIFLAWLQIQSITHTGAGGCHSWAVFKQVRFILD